MNKENGNYNVTHEPVVNETIDELIEKVIDIFGEETEWYHRFSGDQGKLNILGRLRVRFADLFTHFKDDVIADECELCAETQKDTQREPAVDPNDLD